MEIVATFFAVAIKGVILYWWEARKARRASPGTQTITVRPIRMTEV